MNLNEQRVIAIRDVEAMIACLKNSPPKDTVIIVIRKSAICEVLNILCAVGIFSSVEVSGHYLRVAGICEALRDSK